MTQIAFPKYMHFKTQQELKSWMDEIAPEDFLNKQSALARAQLLLDRIEEEKRLHPLYVYVAQTVLELVKNNDLEYTSFHDLCSLIVSYGQCYSQNWSTVLWYLDTIERKRETPQESIAFLQYHLSLGKDLFVRLPSQKIARVLSIEQHEKRPKCLVVGCEDERHFLMLPVESRRFRELEVQLEQPMHWLTFQDEEERFEKRLIMYLLYQHGSLSAYGEKKIGEPYIHVTRWNEQPGMLAWERREGRAESSKVFLPALNWEEQERSTRRIATLLCPRNSKGYIIPGLYQCPKFFASFLTFPELHGVKSDDMSFQEGTPIRSLECRCEYLFLKRNEQGDPVVKIGKRCSAHANNTREYGVLKNEWVERAV